MKKTCTKCQRTLPTNEFYGHPAMIAGSLNECKECVRKRVKARIDHLKKNDPEWAEKEAERQRVKNRIGAREAPQIQRARRAVRALGRSKDFHWHHWCYQEPFKTDVIQMTPQQHRRAHRFLVLDQEHLMYRRCDTMELLNTRKRHEEFLRTYVSKRRF